MRATASALLQAARYWQQHKSPQLHRQLNSSGSVVNQAVQITPGQGTCNHQQLRRTDSVRRATLNISLCVIRILLAPNNEYYQEPVYDNSDNFGLIDPVTDDGPDGVPDNPGRRAVLQADKELAIGKLQQQLWHHSNLLNPVGWRTEERCASKLQKTSRSLRATS